MSEQKKQAVRTNRVFKSLHKPLTYLGVERALQRSIQRITELQFGSRRASTLHT
jgi:hypothetical protein